jgi:hypothetical protein
MRKRLMLLKCSNCGEEILDEEATFCPNCGSPLQSQPQRQHSDYVPMSAILTLIAAAFSVGPASTALYQYHYWISSYGSSAPQQVIGFLFSGIISILAIVFAVAAAAFILKRKFIIFSMLGTIFPLVSAVVTFIIIYQMELFEPLAVLGFTDTMLFSEVSMSMLAIFSAILLFKSRDEFSDQD